RFTCFIRTKQDINTFSKINFTVFYTSKILSFKCSYFHINSYFLQSNHMLFEAYPHYLIVLKAIFPGKIHEQTFQKFFLDLIEFSSRHLVYLNKKLFL